MKKIFTKIGGAMKICAAHAVVVMVLCGVSVAHDNRAQLLDEKISIRIKDAPLEEALKEIESVARVRIFYSIDQLGVEEPVSINVSDQTLRSVLEGMLQPYGIKYKVDGQKRIIFLKKHPVGEKGEASLMGMPSNLFFEVDSDFVVTGTVLDLTTEQPMPGVNIIVKGTANGTTTNNEGKYRIGVEGGDILVFTFIGYKAFETEVGERTTIDVFMEPDVSLLKPVVVSSGYWQVRERENPGNISKVTSEEIERQAVSTPLQALSGRMAGVNIIQNTGMPGGGIDIQIRGRNSLRRDGNSPLYVVDGIPYPSDPLASRVAGGLTFNSSIAPINYINPADIESIQVLKDADATAIYGSRGANGVVLISTKKGSAGKLTFELDVRRGIGEVAHTMDLLNTEQYRAMMFEALSNDGHDPIPEFFKPFLPDLFEWDSTRYTDWQHELIGGTAKQTNIQGSVSGGTRNTQFLFSGNYFSQTTVFPGDFSFDRASSIFNLNHQSDDQKFKLGFSVNYVTEKSTLPSWDPTYYAVSVSPVAPEPFDEEGNLNFADNKFLNNPYSYLIKSYNGKTRNLSSNAVISYEVVRALTIKANLGYNAISLDELNKNPIRSQNPDNNPQARSTFANGNSESWIIEPQIQYNKQIGLGELSLLFGSTLQENTESREAILASGFASDALLENINAASVINVNDASFSKYRYGAVFARANYNWHAKYIVNLTARRDGSSRFGPGNQYGNFGAIGLAWIFSNEAFFETELPFISFGKLRTSFGTTGSDQIGNYSFLDTHGPTSRSYLGTVGLIPSRLHNSEFGWETNTKIEGGIELGFLKNRVQLNTSFYRNRSSNQLVGMPLAATTGFSTKQDNFPATVQNTGWEFVLNTVNIATRKFEWSTSFNLTIPRNELVAFPNIETSSFANSYTVGESIFNTKGFRYTGVDQETGLYTFEDVNGDGVISSPDDLLPGFDISQKYFGGLSNHLSYAGFDLHFHFQIVNQNGLTYLRSFSAPGVAGNQPTIVLNRWQESGDVTDIQRFAITDPKALNIHESSKTAGTNLIGDASFLRLQNVSFSYSFASNFARKLGGESLRVYVQGQNLLTITDYVGLDPETQNSSNLPPLRIVNVGVNMKI